MIHTLEDCSTIEFRRIPDARGNLTPLEAHADVPFAIRRAYWIYGVPGGGLRGGHAYRELHEVVIALSGSFEVHLDDGTRRRTHTLSRGYVGLYVPNMIWRELEGFSTNAVCLVLASTPYDEDDYVRDHDEFVRLQTAPA
jgi:hypothetical protein